MTQLMTMRLARGGTAARPWETLEQPSHGFRLGARPGTVTLNHWAALGGAPPPPPALRDPGVEARAVPLADVVARLRELQGPTGPDGDDDDQGGRHLYDHLLHDPDRRPGLPGRRRRHRRCHRQPHPPDRQTTDLILALSRPGWIDLAAPRNQVATRFLADGRRRPRRRFFLQLLLSLELARRVDAPGLADAARLRLLRRLPPAVLWALALARRWRDHIRVKPFDPAAGQGGFFPFFLFFTSP